MLRHLRRRTIGMMSVVALASGLLAFGAPAAAGEVSAAPERVVAQATTPAGASSFRAVNPCRLLDTRADPGRPLNARETIRLQVAGRCGTPTSATVAVLSLTVTEARAAGFVTAYPAGTQRHATSNLNFLANGTVANSAVVPLNDGAVDLYVHAATELVVDVTGAFVPATEAVRAGRFVAVSPTRLLDTRESGQRGAHPLVVPLPQGVPADATAITVNVTIVEAVGRGFVTAHAAGTPLPLASIQNADQVDRTRAVTVILPVTPAGVRIHRSMVADVLVDFGGWFTGPSAPASTDGLFIPQPPTRIRDSRLTFDPPHTRGTVGLDIPPIPGVAASAFVANTTAVEVVAPGYLTAHPAGLPRPLVSNVNARWRAPVANLTLLPASDEGVSIYAHEGSHLVVDVFGRFTGAPLPSGTSSSGNVMPAVGGRVLFVSDSAFAGIRWLGKLDWLRGATFVTNLESCRRLIGSSCRGREGYAPSNAIDAVRYSNGAFDTLVIAAGYNDYATRFRDGVNGVLAAARARGIPRIVWLTYRQDVNYVSPYGVSSAGTFVANNLVLRSIVASGLAPEIEIAEWHATTVNAPTNWFAGDRLHLSADGARGAATYVSRKLASLERRPCPAGIGGATTPGGWCADPDRIIQFDLPANPTGA